MSIEKIIKRERNQQYKRLRKLRKARDIASKATQNKKVPYRLSLVKLYYLHHVDNSSRNDLAHSIFKGMKRILNIPKPPISKY